MAVPRPSNFLTAKQNIRAVGNRLNEATAEDYVEIANLLNYILDFIELMQGPETPNSFYGVYTSLPLLNATYPTAVAGSYAIIDAGVGSNPQIALWDNTDTIWVLQQTTATTTAKTFNIGDDVTDVRVTDVNGNPHIIVSGTLIAADKDKLESYSINSYTRAL